MIPKYQLWAWTLENREKVAVSFADPRQSMEVSTTDDLEKLSKDWGLED